MKKVLVSAGVACALAICAGAFAANASAPTNVFTDPTGDTIGSSPDVTGLTYTTNAAGLVTFHIATALPDGGDDFVILYVDEDDNLATGETNSALSGADLYVEYDQSSNTYDDARWDQATQKWADATFASDFSISAGSDEVTIAIDRKDLADATRAQVFAVAGAADPSTGIKKESDGRADLDWAPDTGGYTTNFSPLTLTAGPFRHTKAKAGKVFSLSLAATRSDSGQYVDAAGGSLHCSASVGGRRQNTASQPLITTSGVPSAFCSWNLGKKTKGKLLRATITISADGATQTRTFSTRIH